MNPETTTGLRHVKILRPLAIRDFALLWTAMTVSLLGDGIYFVAIAWQVYELSDAPTALSVVGVAWTLPNAFLLVGGVLSDRVDRRRMMIATDLVRALAVASSPSSRSPECSSSGTSSCSRSSSGRETLLRPCVPRDRPAHRPERMLVQANSLDLFIRPF